MEIWEPKLPGTLWATPGLLRDCFTFLLFTVLRPALVLAVVSGAVITSSRRTQYKETYLPSTPEKFDEAIWLSGILFLAVICSSSNFLIDQDVSEAGIHQIRCFFF